MGLAPAAHGGTRTGRAFTGDKSGDFLFKCLYETQVANQPISTNLNDGLRLNRKDATSTVSYADAYLTCVEDSEFLDLLPIHPLVFKESEQKRRDRVRYAMWQRWRKTAAYMIEARVIADVKKVNDVRDAIQAEIDGRGLQECDDKASFNKFYRFLTRNETTYVPPTLNPLSIKNWFPELDKEQKSFLKPRRWQLWTDGAMDVSFHPIDRIDLLVKNAEALMMSQVQAQAARSLVGITDFFERYTSAAGIPSSWKINQKNRREEWNNITLHNRYMRHAIYPKKSKKFKKKSETTATEEAKDQKVGDLPEVIEEESEEEEQDIYHVNSSEYEEEEEEEEDDRNMRRGRKDKKEEKKRRDIIPYFEPFCTGYEVPIFIPAFTCEVVVVNVLDETYRLTMEDGNVLPFSLHPPFSKLETLLQDIVSGIVDCSQDFPSVKFDKEQEKIVWGIPDADYEEQRQEKRKILHAQEAMDNGETIDPADYEVGDASDDDNEDEEEYVEKLGGPVVPGIMMENPMVGGIRKRISGIFRKTEPAVNALLLSLSRYAELYRLGIDDHVNKIAANISIKTLRKCYNLVDHYYEMRANIMEHCNHIEYLPRGLVEIRTFKLKNTMAARSIELARVILNAAKGRIIELCTQLDVEYNEWKEVIAGDLNSSDDIYQMRLTIDDIVKRIMPELAKRFNGEEGVIQYIKFLIAFGHEIEQDYRILIKTIYEWPQAFRQLVLKARARLVKEAEKYLGFLNVQRGEMDGDIKAISSGIKSLQNRGGLSSEAIIEMNTRIGGLRKGMTNAQKLAVEIKHEEEKLAQNDSEYIVQLDTLDSFLEPLERLWSVLAQYQGSSLLWYHTPVKDIDARAAMEEASLMCNQLRKINITEAITQATPSLIASKGAVGVMEIFLNEHFQLLNLVATQGMKESHWQEVSKATATPIPFDPNITLNTLIKVYRLHKKTSLLEPTCIRAHQEDDVRQALNAMEDEWDDFKCEVIDHAYFPNHKTIETHCDEDIELLLDEQHLRSKSLSVTAATEPHIDRVLDWIEKTRQASENMHLWRLYAEKYFHMAAIFKHEEVLEQLADQVENIKLVSSNWDEIMLRTSTPESVFERYARLFAAKFRYYNEGGKSRYNIFIFQTKKFC